jgi:hypothetical protein
MQRIDTSRRRRPAGHGPVRRDRQRAALESIGTSSAPRITTLAPAFGQALPTLDTVPTEYNHEVNAELLYDLGAALVKVGLGSPETWQRYGENAVAFAQHSIMSGIGAQRGDLLQRNVEYHLHGRIFPQPPLVWRVADGQLKIRALTQNKRPESKTKLAVAPYWNLSDNGTVCTGSMRRPESASVAAISDWERGFYESAFTHANVGRLTRHKGGIRGSLERPDRQADTVPLGDPHRPSPHARAIRSRRRELRCASSTYYRQASSAVDPSVYWSWAQAEPEAPSSWAFRISIRRCGCGDIPTGSKSRSWMPTRCLRPTVFVSHSLPRTLVRTKRRC